MNRTPQAHGGYPRGNRGGFGAAVPAPPVPAPKQRPLTGPEADIILAKISTMAPEAKLDLTAAEMSQLKNHLWWKREINTPAGLKCLFPGLGSKGKK